MGRVFSVVLCVVLLVSGASAGIVVESHQSECTGGGGEEDTIEVTVEGCVLYVFHENVVINCCLEYKPAVEVKGSTIRVTEVDEGPPCDCICPFDLDVSIAGLEPGKYTLFLDAFLRPEPLEYPVTIPPCEGFRLTGAEVWAEFGVKGVVVPVYAVNPSPIQGFSFGTAYPLEHALMAEINLEGTVTEEAGAEYIAVDIHNETEIAEPQEPRQKGWATCAVVLDSEPPFEGQRIPAGEGQHIVNLVYDILPPGESVPRSIGVPFVDRLGKPPVAIVFTLEGEDVVPETQMGIIQLSRPSSKFVRSDVNGNGKLTISDPIYLLNYLFGHGPEPPCKDAADANDDGTLDLSDAVAILDYLFSGGTIPPPSPPGPAGPDPTWDQLGCKRNK